MGGRRGAMKASVKDGLSAAVARDTRKVRHRQQRATTTDRAR